ncbi:unnamed protein product [Arctogadus glacialis]
MVDRRTEEHESCKLLNLSLQFLSSLVDAVAERSPWPRSCLANSCRNSRSGVRTGSFSPGPQQRALDCGPLLRQTEPGHNVQDDE